MSDTHGPASSRDAAGGSAVHLPEPSAWAIPGVELGDFLRHVVGSYRRYVGQSLTPPAPADPVDDELLEVLYEAPFALLCHDGGADPRFVYANLTAQRLWERSWDDFVGLPSRLSAEPDDRDARARMLAEVARRGCITDYTGVRISASGRRFAIRDAHVWNVVDQQGAQLGQAARIDTWVFLD